MTRLRQVFAAIVAAFVLYGQVLYAKVLPWVIFIALAVAMLFDPGRDTLSISSAAFAVCLALAAVAFSYARTVDGPAIRDELVFCGERLIGAAVMFMFASVVKHAVYDLPRYMIALREMFPHLRDPNQLTDEAGLWAIRFFLNLLAFVIFLTGLVLAQMGIFIVFQVTQVRVKRRPGHDQFFMSGKTLKEYIESLEAKDQDSRSSTP